MAAENRTLNSLRKERTLLTDVLHIFVLCGFAIAQPLLDLVAGAALLGVALTITYLRLASFRFYLTVLSPAVLIFPGLFLFSSPVSKVVFPQP